MAILKPQASVNTETPDHHQPQLFVLIPCEFMPPSQSEGFSESCATKKKNMLTDTDLEAAQQLLQLSSHSQSRDSAANGEDGEDASSSFPPSKSSPPFSSQQTKPLPPSSDGGSKTRHLTARDTTDVLERGERRRYKPISYLYSITSPMNSVPQKSVRKRKQLSDI
eukprot:TRINITY_DN25826_c0_g1_i1.p1 TRINITY_DN25826_c0_g1~~TRINITY_DN25826_c0_g1_i1.p1  ORF type:complete len:189 (+),score=5.70 TRINITY_DN25826_c0_g1_i1:70-567(+)